MDRQVSPPVKISIGEWQSIDRTDFYGNVLPMIGQLARLVVAKMFLHDVSSRAAEFMALSEATDDSLSSSDSLCSSPTSLYWAISCVFLLESEMLQHQEHHKVNDLCVCKRLLHPHEQTLSFKTRRSVNGTSHRIPFHDSQPRLIVECMAHPKGLDWCHNLHLPCFPSFRTATISERTADLS